MHGNLCELSSDALLLPTRNTNNPKWFPRGPPKGCEPPAREAFTPSRRVIRLEGGAAACGQVIWLGHLMAASRRPTAGVTALTNRQSSRGS